MMKKIYLFTPLFLACMLQGCADPKPVSKSNRQTNASGKKIEDKRVILFFGDSLTAGYGLDETEAFPALIQQKVDSLDLPYKVVNAGVSGETTAGGKGRIDWVLKQHIDVFVLELGANDGLRGIPVAETERNLQYITDKVKEKYPNVRIILTGMMVPPNMGEQYAKDFKNIFPKIANKNSMSFMPFLLEGVAGDRKLNQGDGIHPTAEGHKIIANNMWPVLVENL